MTVTYRTIDADAHVNPPVTFWREYLPARFRDTAPRIEETAEGDFILFEGKRTPFTRVNAMAGTKPQEYKATGKQTDTRPGGWDPGERLKDMALDGVDAQALFGGGPLASVSGELYLASFHSYNQWLADFCASAPDRLLGMAYIPVYDIEMAVGEMKWAASRGLKGAVIPAYAPDNEGYSGGDLNLSHMIMYSDPDSKRYYGDPEFDPLWRTAVEVGMPIHVHLGASKLNRPSAKPRPDARYRRLLNTKLTMAEVIAQFIFSGVLAKYPGLKVVSVESGVGWFGFVAGYIDWLYSRHQYWSPAPIKESPSYYMDKQVYGTFMHDAAGVLLRNVTGAGNIMWSSDYPHTETTWPRSQEIIGKTFQGVPAAEKHRLVCGNARSLYGLT